MISGNGNSGDVAGALDAYETAPAVMLACEGDDMVLASANEAARMALGDRCEFGKPVREMVSGADKGTISLMGDMVGAVHATGRSITRSAHRVRVQDADRRPLEVFWDLTVSPWYADDGSVRGVLAHCVDVTETMRARHDVADRLEDVVTMQDALLPDSLPVLPGVEIAGRYLVAEDEARAGGDWYDAHGLDDGRVALVVGDVAGHGVSAAAAMGRLRAVTQDRLTSGADLEQCMCALDEFARRVPEACAATVCVVLLDPHAGRLEYCTAGHPPPLVVHLEGRPLRLPHTGAAPLATTGRMTVGHARVGIGDQVVLYTDGLLSRPGRSPSESTAELGQVAADASVDGTVATGSAERVCERALDLMTRSAGYADDIAILVAEVIEVGSPLHLDFAAGDAVVPHMHDALATWLESMRVRDLDHIVVQHAVGELVTNVVDHAYSTTRRGGRLTVDAALLRSGDVEIRVADTGRWVPSRAGHERGRGLSIVRGMVDRLVLQCAEDGTVATIRHRLSRPAHILTGESIGGSRAAVVEEPFALSLTTQDGDVSLAGSMDRVGVDELRDALVELADLDRVVIDLEGVTRLPSSAVQALHVACRDAADRGQDLVLRAPAGTTAQYVLELVGLPYVLRQ